MKECPHCKRPECSVTTDLKKLKEYKKVLEGIVGAADDGALGPLFEREDCGDDCICCICDGRRVLEER